MRRRETIAVVVLLALGALLSAAAAPGQDTGEHTVDDVNGDVRFITIDLFVDAGDRRLGSYQIEFSGGGGVTLAGIYGGQAGVYADPPTYDPRALQGGRVVLAALSTETERLPRGETRVASLSLMVERAHPDWTLRLIAAGDEGANRFNATTRAALRDDAGRAPTDEPIESLHEDGDDR